MFAHVSLEISDSALADDFTFPDKWDERTTDRTERLTFVGPKSDTWGPIIGISVDDLQKISAGQKWGYIYGWIEYNDVFPNTSRHRTEWCLQITVVGDITNSQAAPLLFMNYSKYNGTDDECLRKPKPYRASQSA